MTVPSAEPSEDAAPQASLPEGPDALHEVSEQAQRLASSLSAYLEALLDRARVSVRSILLLLALLPLGLLVLVGMFWLGLAFLGYGLATGIGELLGTRPYVGYLITGSLLLLSLSWGLYYLLIVRPQQDLKKKLRDEAQLQNIPAQEGL